MENPLSRREVLKYGAFTTVGGVLTPGVVLAQAVTTDTRGITARDIQLNVGGTNIPAYDARPERAGRYPIIVAISGFTGLSEHHKDVVRRFAHAGYYAIAPELFSREGGMQGKAQPEMSKIAGSVTRAQYLGDVRAAADYAKQQSWATGSAWRVSAAAAPSRSTSPPSIPVSRPSSPGTATSSGPMQTRPAWMPSASRTGSRCRCWASMAPPTPASPPTT
jgi:hypothetical protein